MIRTLIVDDETLLRVTMRSLIDWERRGYTVVADCVGGAQALDYLQSHTVDLLITDVKMPGMSGLELLDRLRCSSHMPVSVVLSGYNEFELVREAFRLGAYDYLLKADLNEQSLGRLLDALRQKVFTDASAPAQKGGGTAQGELAPGDYAAVVFSVDDFARQAARFGADLREKLEKPMLELARQIPRLASRAVIRAVYPSRYELCYQVRDKLRFQGTITSVVRQLQAVWRDYMNLSVSAAVSGVVPAEGVPAAFGLCDTLIKLTVLHGPGAVCTQWAAGPLAGAYAAQAQACDGLISAVCTSEAARAEAEKQAFFQRLEQLEDPAHQRWCLTLIARLHEKLQEYGQSLYELFPEETDYEKTLASFAAPRERELWLRNYLRRVQGSFSGARRQQPDAVKKARLFMEDNYANPELTLKTVADYVGFNEKYFSTRFTKECGCTFITYLNRLRLQHAQELLAQTGLKMYEISEHVGYNSVEHFNHTFKKFLGISPSDYRNNAQKS